MEPGSVDAARACSWPIFALPHATLLVHPMNQTKSLCVLVLFKQAAKQHRVVCVGADQVWLGLVGANQAGLGRIPNMP